MEWKTFKALIVRCQFLWITENKKKWQQTLDTSTHILLFLISLYILYNFTKKNKKTLKWLSNSDIIMTKYYIKKENKLYEKSNRYRGGPGRTYGGV